MNFATYEFWKLLFLCFLASRLVLAWVRRFHPEACSATSRLSLLATALILLSAESPLTIASFLWVVLLGWISILLQEAKQPLLVKNILFGFLLFAQLFPLFYFKYWNFFFNDILGLNLRVPSLLIPMGLSFYTFQTIGFWIDNLRNPNPRPTFLNFLNFCSFFPQIVAGPIEKRENLLPQIEACRFTIVRDNLDSAVRWIVLGLAYKLIVADNLGVFANDFQIDTTNPWHVWIESLVFGIRIYFDFAGYSFIAVGLGLLFGIHLTLNFRCPYWSMNLRDFWKNWHVSLGSWLRDYIYIPLGGRRVRWWAANTLIVFLVSGIWHGAGWGFLIWGLLHGVGVTLCGIRPGILRIAPLQWLVTFIFITFTWIFFLERDPVVLKTKFLSILQPSAYGVDNFLRITHFFEGPSEMLATAFVLGLAAIALAVEGIGIRGRREPYHHARHPAVCVVLALLIVLLAPMEESSFIYFNF